MEMEDHLMEEEEDLELLCAEVVEGEEQADEDMDNNVVCDDLNQDSASE